jgi:fused signal recognition particle receptor
MFGFLKKKLKEAVDKITKKTDEEADVVEEIIEETIEKPSEIKEEKKEKSKAHGGKKKQAIEKPKEKQKQKKKEAEEKKKTLRKEDETGSLDEEKTEETIDDKEEQKKDGFFSKLFKKKEEKKPEEIFEEEQAKSIGKEIIEEEKQEKKTIFEKISDTVTKVSLSEKKFNEVFWELEVVLLENNVALEVVEKIKDDLKKELVENKISRKEIEDKIIETLRKSISSLFDIPQEDILKKVKEKKPYVIMFVGVNGAGKTTTLAKFIYLLKKNKYSCVVGACDTFRAAAIQQIQEHTDRLGVKLIKHDYGSDPAAVAYDTIDHAKSKNIDVVLIDTAGRLHSNKNLMQELEKVNRIANPDFKIFIGESLAGNDVVEQAKLFNEKIGIDGIILSKADTDEKGGAAISVSYVTGKPILYLGTGQTYDDLERFDKEKIIEKLGL